MKCLYLFRIDLNEWLPWNRNLSVNSAELVIELDQPKFINDNGTDQRSQTISQIKTQFPLLVQHQTVIKYLNPLSTNKTSHSTVPLLCSKI